MNPDDMAQLAADRFITDSLQAFKSQRTPMPVNSGFCLFCEGPIDRGRFCNAEHRDAYDAETRQLAIAGKLNRRG